MSACHMRKPRSAHSALSTSPNACSFGATGAPLTVCEAEKHLPWCPTSLRTPEGFPTLNATYELLMTVRIDVAAILRLVPGPGDKPRTLRVRKVSLTHPYRLARGSKRDAISVDNFDPQVARKGAEAGRFDAYIRGSCSDPPRAPLSHGCRARCAWAMRQFLWEYSPAVRPQPNAGTGQ